MEDLKNEFNIALNFFIDNIHLFHKLANVGAMYSFAPINSKYSEFKFQYIYMDLNSRQFWGGGECYRNVSRKNAITLNDLQYEILKLRLS